MASDAGVIAVTVSTADGLEVACLSLDTPAHAGKLAAITSSLQALGVAVSQELGLAALEGVTIEAKFGRVLSVDIPLGHRTLILAVVAKKRSLYALTLMATRDCASRIAAKLAAPSLDADPVSISS